MQLSNVLGEHAFKFHWQYFAEANLNRYVRILLLTSNKIGVAAAAAARASCKSDLPG